ncbi:hypothetical protein ECC01_21550 [Bacillus tequilensis]|nr:hypothetical protein [Bacillus tequilensis]
MGRGPSIRAARGVPEAALRSAAGCPNGHRNRHKALHPKAAINSIAAALAVISNTLEARAEESQHSCERSIWNSV